MAILAVGVALGCGDGIVGAGGATGSAVDTILAEDAMLSEVADATGPEEVGAPDSAPDSAEDGTAAPDIEPSDVQPDPDTEPETCASCTTQDLDCICGCVGCHTNKAVLEELAPPEPVEEVESGGG